MSDDRGATWTPSGAALDAAGLGLIEGTLLAKSDGTILQLFRTGEAVLYASVSSDDGETKKKVRWGLCMCSAFRTAPALARIGQRGTAHRPALGPHGLRQTRGRSAVSGAPCEEVLLHRSLRDKTAHKTFSYFLH
jgi:hypothetical protein